jgi:hypothetical protein
LSGNRWQFLQKNVVRESEPAVGLCSYRKQQDSMARRFRF